MDIFQLVVTIISELIPNSVVVGMATVLFYTACVSLVIIMLSIAMAFYNLADLIRLPLRKQEETKGGRISLWQTIKGWFPRKDKAQAEQ